MEGLTALTPRQREVFTLVAKGLSNHEIAGVLGIAESTVKTHVEKLLRVLGVTNRAEAAGLFAGLEREGAGDSLAVFAERPAVAVLRFGVASDVPFVRTFAAGFVDDLIGLLCRWRWFPVIARSTSYFCDPNQPASRLREQTGAAYLLGGSVSPHGEGGGVRVTVSLDDARSGRCLWSDRFDLPLEEIFALEDEVAATIVNRAYAELFRAESRRARETPPTKLSAWELAHEGLLHVDEADASARAKAFALFDRSTEQDRTFVLPLYGKGMGLCDQILDQTSERVMDELAEVQRCAERAVLTDENDASGWLLSGRLALMAADIERAIPSLEKAVALNRSHARAHSILGQAYVAAGRRVGLEHMRLSARLSPGTDNVGHVLAHFAIGDYEQAITVFRTRGRRSPVPLFEHALACASLALLGDEQGARAELVRLRGVHPGFSRATFATMARPGRSDVSDRILEGLRKAGLED